MRKLLLLYAFLFSAAFAFAQEVTVTGTVMDGDSGMPLPGANILVKGTVTGTISDLDGKYTVKANANSTLVFSLQAISPKRKS